MLIHWLPTPIGDGWDVEPDPIAWLDVGKVEVGFKRNASHYVGIGGAGAGQKGRYNFVGRFIQSGRAVYMPHLSLDEHGAIQFTDGRHRFAWVRDHGAVAIPVTTCPEGLPQLDAQFGTAFRESRVEW